MTPSRARELLEVQVNLAGGYNRNAAKLILCEVFSEHGQKAVDQLIVELDLQKVFGFTPGDEFKL